MHLIPARAVVRHEREQASEDEVSALEILLCPPGEDEVVGQQAGRAMSRAAVKRCWRYGSMMPIMRPAALTSSTRPVCASCIGRRERSISLDSGENGLYHIPRLAGSVGYRVVADTKSRESS